MNVEEPRGLESVTEAALAIEQRADRSAILEEIVRQARHCLPEFEHVGLSLVGPGSKVETLAATTELTRIFDNLQGAAGSGPCLDVGQDSEIVVVENARHEQRWQPYISSALQHGLRSQLGVRIASRPQVCLNLYSTTFEEIDPGGVGVAEHFAVHAGIALGRYHEETHLRTAIGTRTVIGTAIGIVMERYGLNQSSAFAYLVRTASTTNRKVRLVADEIVSEREQRGR